MKYGDIVIDKYGLKGIVVSSVHANRVTVLYQGSNTVDTVNIEGLKLKEFCTYEPVVEIGDRVLVPEEQETGIVFAIDDAATLPFKVGFPDGTVCDYSSKELEVIA